MEITDRILSVDPALYLTEWRGATVVDFCGDAARVRLLDGDYALISISLIRSYTDASGWVRRVAEAGSVRAAVEVCKGYTPEQARKRVALQDEMATWPTRLV